MILLVRHRYSSSGFEAMGGVIELPDIDKH
jgi:hypothetical protein